MTELAKHNLTLFNLMEKSHPVSFIMKILEEHIEHEITEEVIKEVLKPTPSVLKFIDDFKSLDSSYFSIFILYYFGVNLFIIDIIQKKYRDLKSLADDYRNFKNEHFQCQTHEKIHDALNQLNLLFHFSLEQEILKTISECEYCSLASLKKDIFLRYPNFSNEDFVLSIQKLLKNNKILISPDKISLNLIKIEDFLRKKEVVNGKILLDILNGKSQAKIAIEMSCTRQYVDQIVKNLIKKCPIFQNETEYFKILNEYDLDEVDFNILGFTDRLLYRYINKKYDLTPSKNYLDYLLENNLIESEEAKEILSLNKLVYIDDVLLNFDFLDIFSHFIHKNNLFDFKLSEIKAQYNSFLIENKIYDDELSISEETGLTVIGRKLENSDDFIQIKKGWFFYNNLDFLSSEFLLKSEEYIQNFIGYGSTAYFFNNNKNLCLKNKIGDKYILFAVLKTLYKEKYIKEIDFIKNPNISRKDIDKEEFFESLIYDLDLPCKVEEYLSYVEKITGIQQSVFFANNYKIIEKYKNHEGLIDTEAGLSLEDCNRLMDILDRHNSYSINYATKLIKSEFGDKSKKILSPHILKKAHFIKTNVCIYKSEFSNMKAAIIEEVKSMGYILTSGELANLCSYEFFYYKMYSFIDTCALIRIREHTYLNIIKRGQEEMVRHLKDDLYSLVNTNEIVSLKELIQSNKYRNKIRSNPSYKELLDAFNEFEIIKYLIQTNRNLYSLQTECNIVFSLNDITIQTLVKSVVEEEKVLTVSELKNILYEKYSLNKEMTNTYLSDMGFYCPKYSEKIYLNKYYYEEEIKENL